MIRIETLGRHGDGLAHVDGALRAFPLTAPGDGVDPQGRVIDPASARQAPPCPHFGACGGCALQHLPDAAVAAWKQGLVKHALSIRDIDVRVLPTVTVPPGTRRRVTFAATRARDTLLFGFSGRSSNRIIPVESCTVAHPAIMAALPGLQALARLGTPRKRSIRLTVTLTMTGLDVALSDAMALDLDRRMAAATLAEEHDLARLSWNDAVIAERRAPVLRFGPVRVTPPPGAFLQAAAEGEAVLRAVVLRGLGEAGRVADLFAGCGTFAFPMAARAAVDAFESDPAMVEAMARAARVPAGLKPFHAQRRDLFRDPLTAEELGAYDTVVIDPPRAGAAAQAAELARSRVPCIVHLSCSPESFARDAATLIAGGYRCGPVLPLDQFRWSAHVELAAVFTRGPG